MGAIYEFCVTDRRRRNISRMTLKPTTDMKNDQGNVRKVKREVICLSTQWHAPGYR